MLNVARTSPKKKARRWDARSEAVRRQNKIEKYQSDFSPPSIYK